MSLTQIATGLLADTSVTTAKIVDSSVTTDKIADANVTTVKIADSNVTTAKIANASVTPAKLSQPLTQGTAKASTSGTSIDFSPADSTGVPSWAKRITLAFNGVSTNGSSNLQVQIGSSGGIETTGYASCANSYNNSPATSTATSGFLLWNVMGATYIVDGVVQLVNVSGNIWVTSGSMIGEIGAVTIFGGKKTLAGVLDRVRITTVNGTDTFDAGSINILYE